MNGKRILSVDLLRGATVMGMILVNNGWGPTFLPLEHSAWNGLTPCDLVFPFFLFIMGVSIHLSMARHHGRPSRQVVGRILRRGLTLVAIGLAINWLALGLWGSFADVEHLRYFAVLQRIGICYIVVALLSLGMGRRGMGATALLLLAAYAFLLILGHGYNTDPAVNVLGRVDTALFGATHLYTQTPVDPEGLLGTLPSIAHTIVGYLVGTIICSKASIYKRLSQVAVAGTALFFAGYALQYLLPVNKTVWSPSFALVTCGMASLLLVVFAYVADVMKCHRWTLPLKVFGINPLALYISSEVLALLLGWCGVSEAVYNAIAAIAGMGRIASLLYALYFVALNFVIGYILYRKKIFIKV